MCVMAIWGVTEKMPPIELQIKFPLQGEQNRLQKLQEENAIFSAHYIA